MAPIIIPDGFVLVKPRSRETAIALLEAADAVGADRHTSVRTVTGGYHVLKDVAEKFQAGFSEADAEAASDQSGAPSDQTEAQVEPSSEPAPLPVTVDSTHAEIDEYAASLDPKVEFPAGINKAEKISLLEAARQPKTEDAE